MVYLDHAAATPIEPAAIEAMTEAAHQGWAHPRSVHAGGRRSRSLLAAAGIAVAEYLDVDPSELVWATSASAALERSIAAAIEHAGPRVVAGALLHDAVEGALVRAARRGAQVQRLPMPAGEPDREQAAAMLGAADVVVMSALDHELGTAPALDELLPLGPAAIWVIDAAQAAAWLELGALWRAGVVVCGSGRKLGGPSGVGVIRAAGEVLRRVREGAEPDPSLAAIGLGAACSVRRGGVVAACGRGRALGERLLEGLRGVRPDLVHNGSARWVGPIVDVSIPGIEARELESALDMYDVAISRTSACRQHLDDGSPIVAAAFPEAPWLARAATRWSVGWGSTEADVDAAVAAFAAICARVER